MTISSLNKAERIRELVSSVLLVKGDAARLADDESLVVSGRLASVDVLDLVVALEEEFGLDFAAHGFDANDFDSVRAILRMLDAVHAG